MQKTEFVDIDRARQIVQDLYPDAHRIEFIEHGYDNIVALVDSNFAVRFPRSNEAFIRSQYEKSILTKLDAINAVKIPKLLEEHDDPSYLVTSFVAGVHQSIEEINQFSTDELSAFGRVVGTFAHELHSSISVSDEQNFRANAELGDQFEESWGDYFTRVVAHGTFMSPEQTAIAEKYYQQWKNFEDGGNVQVVVHDDLHTHNMLFEGKKLVGVLDFAGASIGTAEQELRQLYRINEQAMHAAIETYQELSGQKLDVEAIKTWAVMRELGAYSRRLGNGETDHPGFTRTCEYLNRWLPSGRWG